jgi:hypothetical protein
MKKFFLFATIAFVSYIIQSCSDGGQASVYQPGRIWNYDVTIQDSSSTVVDSFKLNMKTRNSNIAEGVIRQITVEYEYLRDEEIFDAETTGIEDNSERVHIHPPRNSFFDIAEIVHFPFITKPIGAGFTASTDMNIQKAFYINRKTNAKVNLAGKKIKQEIALIDSTNISFKNKEIKCYVIEGKNLNYIEEIGQFTGKFYFNEKYGFIQLVYTTPWKSTVTANLKSVNF